jgi:hypothetical protein
VRSNAGGFFLLKIRGQSTFSNNFSDEMAPKFSFCLAPSPRQTAAVEDFLQVSCENRGTRIVMPGLQAPAPATIQGYS